MVKTYWYKRFVNYLHDKEWKKNPDCCPWKFVERNCQASGQNDQQGDHEHRTSQRNPVCLRAGRESEASHVYAVFGSQEKCEEANQISCYPRKCQKVE